MNPNKQNTDPDLPEESVSDLERIPKLTDEDLQVLQGAVEEIQNDPAFQADYLKSYFIEAMLEAMEEANLKQIDVAKRWGKSRQYLSKLLNEDHRVNFTIETMCEFAHLLKRRLDILVLRSTEESHIIRTTPQIANSAFPPPLSKRQIEVFELLKGLADDRNIYHEWYRSALQCIRSQLPDKLSQAAHSIRELLDKLPKRIASIPTFQTPLPAFKDLKTAFLELKTANYRDGWKDKAIDARLNKLLIRMEGLFTLFSEPSRTARLGVALRGSDPRVDLISKPKRKEQDEMFENIGKFFQNVAHHNMKVDESEFQENLENLESLLLNYLTPCTADQQNEILELIREGPSATNLRRINELISHKGANFVFFFQNLDNPNWLGPLEKSGYFSNLPDAELGTDNARVENFHIPLIALNKLAIPAPHAVTKILAKLNVPNNRRVGDQILECMGQIHDVGCIAQLRPLISQYRENPGMRASWFRILDLLISWTRAGAISDVLDLTGIFLCAGVNFGPSSSSAVDAWTVTQVAEKVLAPLILSRPLDVARIVFEALTRWASIEQEKYERSEQRLDGPFSYWLEDFKIPGRSHRELESTLILSLFAAIDHIYAHGEASQIDEADNLLRSNPWRLFQRMRWQLYVDYPLHNLERSRQEVVARIPFLAQLSFIHDYEFAMLLRSYATSFGAGFLGSTDVKEFFDSVLRGPLEDDGKPFDGYERNVFQLKQLWPISTLLTEEQLLIYQSLAPESVGLDVESYKPFRSGAINASYQLTAVAPPEAEHLATMEDETLYHYLNTWEPRNEYPTPGNNTRENLGSLGAKFAELVSQQPERFAAEKKWWQKLTRAAIIHQVFNNAINYFIKIQNTGNGGGIQPTDNDWANWFGIARYIIDTCIRPNTDGSKELSNRSDWNWSLKSVATFYRMALRSTFPIPAEHLSNLRETFETMISLEDSPGEDCRRPSLNDWLTTAINSLEGEIIEALLNLASRQRNASREIETWIFSTIRSRIERPGASPAVFALLGGNLTFVAHLFESQLTSEPQLLFPVDRPAHLRAAIVTHFCYQQPHPKLIQVFPNLIRSALEVFKQKTTALDDASSDNEAREFSARLATHIAVYHINGAFPTEEFGDALLDQFFSLASESSSAGFLSQLGGILAGMTNADTGGKIIARGMRILERRYGWIVKDLKANSTHLGKFDQELSSCAYWLNCEQLPFDWRIGQARLAFECMQKPKHLYTILGTLALFGVQENRLNSALDLLLLILAKRTEELQWSVRVGEIRPVISLGLASEDVKIRRQAELCRDSLLKLGFFDFRALAPTDAK